jgi:hypothetical protein
LIDESNKVIELNSPDYYNYIEKNKTDKLNEYDVILSAVVTDDKAKFDIVEVSELYKYNIMTVDVTGENAEVCGHIIPNQRNKKLEDNEYNFNTLSVDLVNANISIDKFKKLYVLPKSVDKEIWQYQESDDDGNTFVIVFNANESVLKTRIITKQGFGEAHTYAVNVKNAEIFNVNDCHTFRNSSNEIDLTVFNNSYEESFDIFEPINVNPEIDNNNVSPYTLDINDASNILKVAIPKKSELNVAREFAIIIKPICKTNKLVEIQLTDASGNKVDYISNRRDKILIPTNKWTNLQVNEINQDRFFIKDFDGNENAHDIRILSVSIEKLSSDLSGEIDSLSTALSGEIDSLSTALSGEIDSLSTALSGEIDSLSTALSGEIDSLSTKLSTDLSIEIENRISAVEKLSTDLSGEIDSLSTKLSTDLSNEISARLSSFEYLSSQISSNDNDIAEIFARIKGGINYKGTVVCEIKSTDSVGENIKDITYISALFFREGTIPSSLYDDENKVLSNGFMYIVNAVDAVSKKKFIIEGKDIEVGDQIIINCKDTDGKAIKDLTINDVDIIDNEDYDTVYYPVFENLSIKLSTEIDLLSDSLSTTTKLSVENLQNQIISNDNDIEYLSSEISSNDVDINDLYLSAHELCA